jgi:hypothetical protein
MLHRSKTGVFMILQVVDFIGLFILPIGWAI